MYFIQHNKERYLRIVTYHGCFTICFSLWQERLL